MQRITTIIAATSISIFCTAIYAQSFFGAAPQKPATSQSASRAGNQALSSSEFKKRVEQRGTMVEKKLTEKVKAEIPPPPPPPNPVPEETASKQAGKQPQPQAQPTQQAGSRLPSTNRPARPARPAQPATPNQPYTGFGSGTAPSSGGTSGSGSSSGSGGWNVNY